jgi:TonB family protein
VNGEPSRLREADGTDALEARAAAVVRAASEPPPALTAAARARVLAALRAAAAPRRSTGMRLVLQAGVLAALAATGLAAVAGLSWYRESRPPAAVPVSESPPARLPEVLPQPAPSPEQPVPRVKVVRAEEPVAAPPTVIEPRLAIDPQEPRYGIALPPDLARAGAVLPALLEVCVAADGRVTKVKVRSSPSPRLDSALSRMVRTWRFFPARRDGIPVPSCTTVRYELAISASGR